jgi:hydroxymethylbilane synthase
VRLGTRGSALALAQAQLVADAIGDAEIVAVKTSGDRGERGGDKARFVREIEHALLGRDVDLGVHSAKDLPTDLPDGLEIVGVPAREDAADCFIGEAGSLAGVPEGARVGTASLRRRSQLLALRPDLEIGELRGNVDTRLRRLEEGEYDGVVLAAAGLRRLGREPEIAFRFAVAELTPAAGQGALALEARSEDAGTRAAAGLLTDAAALVELTAERAAVTELEATCHTPVGVHARLDGEALGIEAFVGLPDGSDWVRDAVAGDAEDPVALGLELARRLIAAGAGEILERAEGAAQR